MYLKLPTGITIKELYNDQNIWFLAWVLKQHQCYSYLIQYILEKPFTVKRKYNLNGDMRNIAILKNGLLHGIHRNWNKYGILMKDFHWKDGKKNGVCHEWKSTMVPHFLSLKKGYYYHYEFHYINDKKLGEKSIIKTYYEGSVVREETYNKGYTETIIYRENRVYRRFKNGILL